jgi:ATP phosphoribosyltransferase
MMNAPKTSISKILGLLPGLDEPSIIPLGLESGKVAIHAVAREEIFWETIEKLKSQGASSILVLPIEKVIL